MSERLAFPETISAVDALTREERRKIRRVGVSLQVRIRPADFEDGDFRGDPYNPERFKEGRLLFHSA